MPEHYRPPQIFSSLCKLTNILAFSSFYFNRTSFWPQNDPRHHHWNDCLRTSACFQQWPLRQYLECSQIWSISGKGSLRRGLGFKALNSLRESSWFREWSGNENKRRPWVMLSWVPKLYKFNERSDGRNLLFAAYLTMIVNCWIWLFLNKLGWLF